MNHRKHLEGNRLRNQNRPAESRESESKTESDRSKGGCSDCLAPARAATVAVLARLSWQGFRAAGATVTHPLTKSYATGVRLTTNQRILICSHWPRTLMTES